MQLGGRSDQKHPPTQCRIADNSSKHAEVATIWCRCILLVLTKKFSTALDYDNRIRDIMLLKQYKPRPWPGRRWPAESCTNAIGRWSGTLL